MAELPGRTGRLTTAVPPDPEAIFRAIMRVRDLLDRVDDGRPAQLGTVITRSGNCRDDARAWALTALLIADMCEVDSMTLNALANSVWKGRQDALDYR